MPLLSDFDSAARMKESISAVAAEVIEATIPRARYATVTGVNPTTRSVTVVYPDEGTGAVLPGNSILPDVGAVVRVNGYQGARFIDDVVSGGIVLATATRVEGALTVNGSTSFVGSVSGASASFSSYSGPLNPTNLSSPVPITHGGTGGTTQATARTGIGLTAMSVAASASTLVQRDASGYITGTYINMTADVVTGSPTRIAGQGGDNFMRWYTGLNASMLLGSLPNSGLNSGTYSAANLTATATMSCATLISSGTVTANNYVNAGHIRGGGNTTGGYTGGNGAVLLDDSGDNYIHMDWNGSALLFYVDSTFIFYATPGSILNSVGTKTFVIDNPIDESKYLVHACVEGPTTDVFYRGRARLGGNGLTEIRLPDYFEELTTENRNIFLTGIKGPAPWVETEIVGGSFIVKGEPDQEFFWRVDAERRNASFVVEPLKAETNVEGFGPYRFIR